MCCSINNTVNKIFGLVFALVLMISALMSVSYATTPATPLWQEADLTVLPNDNDKYTNPSMQSGWVTVSAERPAFFELRSGQIAQLLRRENTSKQLVKIHITQGRGLFPAQADIDWRETQQVVTNPRSRDVWVMLRATEKTDVKLRFGTELALRGGDYWQSAPSSADTLAVSNVGTNVSRELRPLQQDETFSYVAKRDEQLKLDYFVDFENLKDLSNVPVRFSWKIDQQTPHSSVRYANFNFRALSQSECGLALSFRESLIVELKRGQTLEFQASQPGFTNIASNHTGNYIFARNRVELAKAPSPEFDRSLLSEKWYPLLRAYNLSVPLTLTKQNNKLTTRRALYPKKNRHLVNWAYSVRGRPFNFQRQIIGETPGFNGLHFSKEHSRSNLTKMVLGQYQRLDADQPTLAYSLPPNRLLRELELEIATPDAAASTSIVPLSISIDKLPAKEWLLVPALQALSGQASALTTYLEAALGHEPEHTGHVSFSDAFADLKQRAPMVQTNLAYIAIPDSAKQVTVSLSKIAAEAKQEHWVSLRDFVYRSNLGDIAVLNDSKDKNLARLSKAFNLFRSYGSNFVGFNRNIPSKPSAASLERLLKSLEMLPFDQQRDLIQWARFFHVVRGAHDTLKQEYIAESDTPRLRRFSDLDDSIWRDLRIWLRGPQPTNSLDLLTGLSLHHPDQAVRLQAINWLREQEGTLLSPNRMEQVLLAYLYQDMQHLETVLPSLMQLWVAQGKYFLTDLLPKPTGFVDSLEALTSAVYRRPFSPDELAGDKSISQLNSTQNYSTQHLNSVVNLLTNHTGTESIRATQSVIPYLEKFMFWRANQQPVQQYTQHLNLQHRSRAELNQKAYLLGPNSSLVVKSNELQRYRLKVASFLQAAGSENSKKEGLGFDTIIIGKQRQTITGVNQSNWFAVSSANDSTYALSGFSNISFSPEHQNQSELTISANTKLVVYLERAEDPAGLLQRFSNPLESIDAGAYELGTSHPSSIQAYLSIPPTQAGACNKLEHKSLKQGNRFRAVDISFVKHHKSPSRSAPWLATLGGDVSGSRMQPLASGRYDVAKAAELIHWSEDKDIRRRYPDLRATAFQQVRWRELLDVPQHAGMYRLGGDKPTIYSQAEQQRVAFSSDGKQDYRFSISGQNAQGFTIYSPVEQPVRLKLAARKTLFKNVESVKIWVQVGNQRAQPRRVNMGASRELKLPLKQGNNVVKLWVAASSAGQTMLFDFDLPSNIQPIQESRNSYFSATTDKAINLAIQGPQRLKVVASNADGQTKISERNLPSGLNKLRFDVQSDYKYFRFFVLQENYDTSTKVADIEPFSLRRTGCHNNVACLTRDSELKGIELNNLLAFDSSLAKGQPITSNRLSTDIAQKPYGFLNQQDIAHIQAADITKPTLGLDLRWVDRDVSDDDPDSIDQLDAAFIQVNGWRRQNRVNGNQISSLDATFRRYDLANVYRGHVRNDWLESGNSIPISYALGGELWHQTETGLNPSISSGQLYARARLNRQTSPRLSLSTRGRAWYRASDIDDATDFSLLDSDVWSQFKQDHQYGVGLAQRATYRHRLDSQAYAEANVLSNENPLSLDRYGVLLGWRSYFGRASGDISLSHRQFFDDDDRNQKANRTDLNLSADWLLPISQQSNFRLSARARFNTDENEVSWWLNLGWFEHAGQQLFDLRADELRFRRPRDWWLRRSGKNNHLKGDTP